MMELTLLHLIVSCGNEESEEAVIGTVSLLQLKKQNARDETAVHEAARDGHVNMARAL